jgi:uncharacterized protein (TIRG00374 family)
MHVRQTIGWFFASKTPGAQRARRLVKLLVLLVLFAAIFWMVPLKDVVQAIRAADPALLAVGMGLGFVSMFLSAVELEPLTRNQGIRHNFGRILLINLSVKFYTQFMPTTLVGSGIRWYRLAQPGGKVAESLAALAFFRALETFLTLAIGLGFWLMSGKRGFQVNVFWLVALIITLILGWVLITRYSLPIYRWFTSRATRIVEKPWIRPVVRYLEKFLGAVSTYAEIPALDLLLAVSAGIASAFTAIFSGTVLARSIGIEISFVDMGWIQAVILFATQLPFAVAGGLGIREVTLIAILSTFGVSAELALALSFLLLLRGFLLGLVGGIIEAIELFHTKRSTSAGASLVDTTRQDTKES